MNDNDTDGLEARLRLLLGMPDGALKARALMLTLSEMTEPEELEIQQISEDTYLEFEGSHVLVCEDGPVYTNYVQLTREQALQVADALTNWAKRPPKDEVSDEDLENLEEEFWRRLRNRNEQ